MKLLNRLLSRREGTSVNKTNQSGDAVVGTSRRDFFRNAGVAAAGVAALPVLGRVPDEEPTLPEGYVSGRDLEFRGKPDMATTGLVYITGSHEWQKGTIVGPFREVGGTARPTSKRRFWNGAGIQETDL